MRILVLNGPNLNLLGVREPGLYGTLDYKALLAMLEQEANTLGVSLRCVQSNHEGDLVDAIQNARLDCQGIVINPAAYTHTSIAILDALKAVQLPAAEVHITDISQREEFRKISYAGMACQAHFIGHGVKGYLEALDFVVDAARKNQKEKQTCQK